jgi:hypothetical protein
MNGSTALATIVGIGILIFLVLLTTKYKFGFKEGFQEETPEQRDARLRREADAGRSGEQAKQDAARQSQQNAQNAQSQAETDRMNRQRDADAARASGIKAEADAAQSRAQAEIDRQKRIEDERLARTNAATAAARAEADGIEGVITSLANSVADLNSQIGNVPAGAERNALQTAINELTADVTKQRINLLRADAYLGNEAVTGVPARYVRVYPGRFTEGWLHFSQLMVFNTSLQNVALRKPTFATSSMGRSNGKDITVDGTFASRPNDQIFHSGSPNPSREVFTAGTGYTMTKAEAEAHCTAFSARLATNAELTAAQQAGAQWCWSAWLSDHAEGSWPMQQTIPGCGGPGISRWTPGDRRAGANCFGFKPDRGVTNQVTMPFSNVTNTWNQPATQYWEVDLGRMEPIVFMAMWERGDCCTERNYGMVFQLLNESRGLIKEYTFNRDAPKGAKSLGAYNIIRVAPELERTQNQLWTEAETARRQIAIGNINRCIGIRARRVRIVANNCDGGRNWLIFSQVQVWNTAGVNVAVRKRAYATNPAAWGQGGWANDSWAGLCQPSHAVDGFREPRAAPMYHSTPFTSTSFWEVDLGANEEISYIVIFTHINGPGRLVNAKLQLINEAGAVINDRTITETRIEHVYSYCTEGNPQAAAAAAAAAAAGAGLDGVAVAAGAVVPSPFETYLAYIMGLMDPSKPAPTVSSNAFGRFTIPIPDIPAYIRQIAGMTATISQSREKDFFEVISKESPINFMYDFNVSSLPAPVQIPIYGDLTPTALSELNENLRLCRMVYLGSPADVDRYLRIALSDLKLYMRSQNARPFCQLEVINRTKDGVFITEELPAPIAANGANCAYEINADRLALFPPNARNFIKNWAFNRMKRITQYKFRTLAAADLDARINAIQYIQPNTYGLDISQKTTLDTVAQAFYEMLDGRYSMSQIYDIFPIGSSILDIRFELVRHRGPAAIQTRIDALQARFRKLINSNVTQDIIDQAQDDYDSALEELQAELSEAVEDPIPMLGRFFYRRENGVFVITGFTLDQRAVTSFIPELNCGMTVTEFDEKVRADTGTYKFELDGEGNVNYTPITKYTKNPTPEFDIRSPELLRTIMRDYQEAAVTDLSGAFATATPTWDLSGSLIVTEVLGGKKIGTSQCILRWRESILDEETNQFVRSNIERTALFTYVKNEDDWFAREFVFDASGFRFLTTDSIGDCRWDPAAYKAAGGSALAAMTNDQLRADYLNRGMAAGLSVCPSVNPGGRFDAAVYEAANPGMGYNGNTYALRNHYISFGINENRVVVPAAKLDMFNPTIKLRRPLPAEFLLDDSNGLCPARSCTDPKILYNIVKQYNEDEENPGNILRVVKATTPNPLQCDMEFDIDYTVKKGGKAAPAGLTGIRRETRSFALDLDKGECEYSLMEAGDPGSGTSILDTTPALYRPMEYTTEFRNENTGILSGVFDTINGVVNQVLTRAKSAMNIYRANTYAAVGNLVPFDGCPATKCSNPDMIQRFITFYDEANWKTHRLTRILRAGNSSGTACDYTFERAPVTIGADGRPALGPAETAGLRVSATSVGGCAFRFSNATPVLPSPPESVIQNTANKDFNIANLYSEGAVNVTNNRPFRWVNCRSNGFINFIARNDQQITTMLATARSANQVPTLSFKNDSAGQCSFTGGGVSKKIQFDLDSFGNPSIVGSSSPAEAALTPTRTIAATSTTLPLPQPVTAAPNCATLNTVFASLPTVFEGRQKSPNVCEVRVMGEPELGQETSFGNIYKEVEFYQEPDNSYQLLAVRPSPQDTSLFKDAFRSSVTLDPKATDLMTVLRAYIKDKKPTWRLGRILRAGTDSTGAILYEATLSILDANGAPVSFYSAPSTAPAIMRVTFRRGLTEPKAPYVTSLELAGSVNSTFIAITDPAGVALTDPFTAVYKYKTIKMTVSKARESTEAQLMRLELYKNNIRVPAGSVKISVEGKPDVKTDFLMETAAMDIMAPEKASFLTLPVPFTLVISMTPPDEVDSFSFMTGPDPTKDPLQWSIQGTANDVLYRPLHAQSTDATYPDYGLWRIGQTSFTGRPTGEVTQNAARLKGLKECGYRPTDLEIITMASELVYKEHSKTMPGYSATSLNAPRAYLAGIQAYEFRERDNSITFMPVIHYVFGGVVVQELREDGPKLPYIKMVFNKVMDCVPTLNMTASKVETGRPTGATFLPFPATTTQKALGTKPPFAWGGYPTALTDRFRRIGNFRFSKQNAAGESNEYRVVTYTSSGPDAPQQIPYGASTYELAPEGGAQICAGDPKCVAFFDSSELGGKYSGVFYSAPTGNTRLTEVQPRAYQSTNDFLGRAISESSQNLYVKKEYELFRQVRLTGLKPRSPLSVDLQLGKLIFYAGATPIKVTPNSAMNLDAQLAMTGTPASPPGSGPVNLFSYTTDTQWVAPTNGLGGVVFSFDMPIVASGYSIVTGTQDYARDVVRWKLEVSMDGRTWKTLDDKSARDQDIPQARRLEQKRVDFYPELVKDTIGEGFQVYVAPKMAGMDFGMKTLGSCEKTCDDDGLLNTMMGVYAEKTGNKMNVTSVGYDPGANECVVGYDDGTSKNKTVGFQFTPTFDSCETMIAPANIKINETPTKPADQLLPHRPIDAPYRYIRFRPQVLAGGGSAVQLGKIVFFQGGKIHPLTGAVAVNPSNTDKTVEGPLSRNTAPAAIEYGNRTTQWTDTTLGTLHITLPAAVEFDAFTLVTGSDPRRAPVRWTLESSTDGRIWRPLHMQNDSDVTAPTSQFTQYLMYFFDTKKEPIAVRNMFEKSLGSFGKRCDDMDILEAVSSALARQNPPILFSPTKFAYNETLNKCDYVQSQDSSTVGIYLNTDVYGNTTVRGVEKTSTTVGPTPSQPVASGRLFGLEECLVGPAACERPALVDYVKNSYERRDFRRNKDLGEPQTGFPLSVRGFGLDSARNECVYELDDAYVPPLYQSPQIVGIQFKKGTSCSASGPEVLGDIHVREKNVLPLTRAAVSSTVKYVRFRPFRTRSAAAGTVRLGGLELFNGDEPVSMNGVQVSNPMGTWVGSAADFSAEGWEDRHKKALVFAFPNSVQVSHYRWRTAKGEGSEGDDPVRWKLEGSPNGTFWMTLHDMSVEETSVPTARGAETQKYQIRV